MYKWIFLVIYVLLPFVAMAETCVKAGFNITYSCGEGTLISGKTLPETKSVDYGASFYVDLERPCSLCTPPNGKLCVGQGLFVDDNLVALHGYTGSVSSKYYFTSDMVVAPYYISKSDIADIDALRANLSRNSEVRQSNVLVKGVSGEWEIALPMGVVRGKSKCGPETESDALDAIGFIPENQEAIDNATSGSYCYCKITEPDVNGLWVFGGYSYPCAKNCAEQCTYSHNAPQLMSGMLSGVM